MDSEAYNLTELRIARSPWDPRHVAPAVPRGCRAVLDVGCGAGQTLIAADLEETTLAFGIDCDFNALRVGRRLTRGVHFICARGERLPLQANAFDFVISRVALPYMHIPSALAEIARVMQPGGRLWIVLHPCSMTLCEMARSLRWLSVKNALSRMYVLANGLVFHFTSTVFAMPFSKARWESFQTRRGIRRALHATGFGEIEIVRSKFFVVTARKVGDG